MRDALDRPNFILINCDDLGYGDLGCTGSELHRTPTIDRMAAEGMRLTDFYMAAPLCSPSRAAMMTGCYPRRNSMDVYDNGHAVLFPGESVGLHPDEITVARLLKDQGYATQIVGKWHCGDQREFLPTRHGFDHYFGVPYSNDMGRQCDDRKAGQPCPLPLLDDESVLQQQPDQAALTERYVERCARFLRDNRDRPFFLYLAHMHVHLPLTAPRAFLDRSQNGPYGAAVECIDWSVAAIAHELKQLGLDANTLVVFTSDNGSRADFGPSNGPLRGRKGQTHEGGMRVPGIFRWPGQISAGSVCRELATAMDILPTFARLAGCEAPRDRVIDGRDIGPLLMGEPNATTPHEAFFYYRVSELQAVRSGKWKLRLDSGELYDLDADLGETTDVAAAHADVVKDLQARADACRRDLGDALTGAEGANRRPIGKVEDPKTLTEYDPDHPYIMAEYDMPQRG